MIQQNYSILPWSSEIENAGVALLKRYQETSMFLLSNLKECGSRVGELFYSGNFKCLIQGTEVKAVFCLSKNGHLLVQSDRKEDYSSALLAACLEEGIYINGCVAEWSLADAFWQYYIKKFPNIKTATYSKELLFSLNLSANPFKAENIRFLTEKEFDLWEPLNAAYFEELHFPTQGSTEERVAAFKARAKKGYWWGYFADGKLISIAAYNACIEDIAQIGGVYTLPAFRKKGIATQLLRAMIADSYHVHRLKKLLLFTDEANTAARKLYTNLGFQETGNFGLIFGEKL